MSYESYAQPIGLARWARGETIETGGRPSGRENPRLTEYYLLRDIGDARSVDDTERVAELREKLIQVRREKGLSI